MEIMLGLATTLYPVVAVDLGLPLQIGLSPSGLRRRLPQTFLLLTSITMTLEHRLKIRWILLVVAEALKMREASFLEIQEVQLYCRWKAFGEVLA